MKLSEILEHLTYGELSVLEIGGLKFGAVQPKNYAQIISFINMGMTDLYKKFPLLEKNVVLELQENITEYVLTYDHAQSNPNPVDPMITRYIADTGYQKPFEEDVLQIHSIFDKNFEELPLNDLNERTSLFTIADNIVQIPYPGQGEFVDLIYTAYPEKISLQTTACETIEVAIPQQLLAALLAYVGYRAHIALPAGDNSKGTEHLSRYFGMTEEIRLLGTLNKQNLSNTKAIDKGFIDLISHGSHKSEII